MSSSKTEAPIIKPVRNASLRSHNTLALPARAAAQVSVCNEQQLRLALEWAVAEGLPAIALGQGSNVVLAGDVDALVVQQESQGINVLKETDDCVLLRVAAGENWHGLVQSTLGQGYFGLENLALIPGTAGAAPIQNIGAYGVELESTLQRVIAIDITNGEAVELAAAECQFGYRDSIFKHALKDQLFITGIELRLSKNASVNISYPALAAHIAAAGIQQPTPQQVFDAVVSIRSSKLPDPDVEPNAGSFFKNPLVAEKNAKRLSGDFPGIPLYTQEDGSSKVSAAWMIDQCGWKGTRRGDIGVHPQHALVLVNYGSGEGSELLSLAAEIASSVLDRFGVSLEIEPRIYGATA